MADIADMSDMAGIIEGHLAAKGMAPNAQWLQQLLPSIRANTPLAAAQRTAEFRMLGTDITTSVHASPSSTFPAGISNPDVKELRIPGPVAVQVLDIEDAGRSRWSQVEAIEMEERGETRKGHEVIRVVPEDNSDTNPSHTQTTSQAGPHKLLVQDAKGNKVYAFEAERVQGVGVGMPIGTKLVLRDLAIARGVILLAAQGTEVLGGKIEEWDKKWKEDRKRVLKEKAGWREGADGAG